MGRMIPEIMFNTGSEGEERVFESLKNSLPDNYIVFHSLRWIEGHSRSQGEADFVIFHPQKGILVIEVKAGILENKNRQWYQTNRNSGIKKAIRDPEEQASASKFKFIEIINNNRCLVCHAVWFPSIIGQIDNLPPNYNILMLFDMNSLEKPKEAIDNAFNYWSNLIGKSTNLNGSDSEKLISILAPSFHLAPSLQYEYNKREQQFVQLTHDQSKILDFLQLQEKATIAGAAGTGKTLIAIEKARQLYVNGRKVVFICYNRLLKDYLNIHFGHYGFKITTFDSLAVQFVGVQDDFIVTQRFFLDFLLDKENDFPYSDVVIDEGQDFENDWLEYLDYRIKGSLYVFYDPQQSLYSDELCTFLLQAPTRLSLTTNCRNTKAIALTAYGSLGSGLKNTILSDIVGKQPGIIVSFNPNTDADKINELIKTFIDKTKADFHKIAILTLSDWNKSMLSFIIDHINFPFSDIYANNKICITTARKFKGLEADLVIIADLDWNKFNDVLYRKLFYSSCSRAKHELYLLSPDINSINTEFVLSHTLGDSTRKGQRKFLKLFNLNATV